MKKSLVLAMAMALGVTASAYAANPFSDVPAGHWAYDSISQLTAAGVVEGYPDGSFKGQNLMTRYEMAQIVAKAMAKGANVDKLAAEFADELNKLGVRVTALEKKADNVKITGNIRYDYRSYHGTKKQHGNRLRSDITIAGQINEDWKYTAMLREDHNFANFADEQKDTTFQRAFVDGKLGGLKVRAGRAPFNDGSMAQFNGSNIYDDRADIISATYGKDIALTVTAGKAVQSGAAAKSANWQPTEKTAWAGDFVAANLQAQLGKAAAARVGYFKFKDVNAFDQNAVGTAAINGDDNAIWTVGAKINLGKKAVVAADYYKSDADEQDKGWAAGLQIGKADTKKPGTWDIFVKYMDMEANSYIANGQIEANASKKAGIKGFNYGVDYVFAKNIMGKVMYNDFKHTVAKDDAHDRVLWTSLHLSF